jgi:hypothetical protein
MQAAPGRFERSHQVPISSVGHQRGIESGAPLACPHSTIIGL